MRGHRAVLLGHGASSNPTLESPRLALQMSDKENKQEWRGSRGRLRLQEILYSELRFREGMTRLIFAVLEDLGSLQLHS